MMGQQRARGSRKGATGPKRAKGKMGSTLREERMGNICLPCNAQPGKGLCGEGANLCLVMSWEVATRASGVCSVWRQSIQKIRDPAPVALVGIAREAKKRAGSFLSRNVSFPEKAPGEQITPVLGLLLGGCLPPEPQAAHIPDSGC